MSPSGITWDAMDVLQVAWELDDFLLHLDGLLTNQAMDWIEYILGIVFDGCQFLNWLTLFYCFAILLGYLFQIIVHLHQLLDFCLFRYQRTRLLLNALSFQLL